MAYKFCKEDVSHRIKDKKKPYIDSNLQLRIPELENTRALLPSSLYSHYSTLNSTQLSVDEQELQKSMLEAKQSYQAWKKLQKEIQIITEHQLKD